MPTRTKPDLRDYLDLEDLLSNKLQSLWGEEAARVFHEVEQAIKRGDNQAAQEAVNSLDLQGMADKLKGFAYTISHATIELGADLATDGRVKFNPDDFSEQIVQGMVRQLMGVITQAVAPQMQSQLAQLIAPPVAKQASRPLYISRPLLNAPQVIQWAKDHGFQTALTPEDMHVTVVYSRKPVDWTAYLPDTRTLTYEGGPDEFRALTQFGQATVLEFKAVELRLRHEAWAHAGASWDYPEYRPHVTISYSGPGDLSKIPPYQGPLVFGGEQFEPIDAGKEFVEKRDVSDEPRDDHGRWTTDGAPVAVHSIDEAIKVLGRHRGIMLETPKQAVTLLDRLQQIAKDAQSKGSKAPVYDLCKVYVKDTNLFCQQSMRIPRDHMPQLAEKPQPGSPADKLPRNEWGEVNLTDSLAAKLQSEGVKIERTTMDASLMRATQNQLNGAKVAQIIARYEDKGVPSTPLMVSREGYIVDGHHRWAAQVGMEFKDGRPMPIPVIKVDMSILPLLKEAIDYSVSQGVMPKPLSNKQLSKQDCGCDGYQALFKDWDESKHPRVPSGSAEGGQFTDGQTPETPTQADTRTMPDPSVYTQYTMGQIVDVRNQLLSEYGVKTESADGSGQSLQQWGTTVKAAKDVLDRLKGQGLDPQQIKDFRIAIQRGNTSNPGADGETNLDPLQENRVIKLSISPPDPAKFQEAVDQGKLHHTVWNTATRTQDAHRGDMDAYARAVFLHELGHALTTEDLFNNAVTVKGFNPGRIYDKVSAYGATNPMEGLAETFAAAYSEDQPVKPLPDDLKSIASAVLHNRPTAHWSSDPKKGLTALSGNLPLPPKDFPWKPPADWPKDYHPGKEDAHLIAQGFAHKLKFNPYHEPPGSPQGVQFTSADAAGASSSQGPTTGTRGVPENSGGDRSAPSTTGVPHFGHPVAGAQSVLGVHYSRAPRQELDSVYYGTGMRGAEANRLQGADPRLSQRIYFYVDTGKGTRPEDGVGSFKHEVQLDNLYNPKSDGYKIWREGHGDANASELAVLNHGFDGYYVDDFGVNQGVAVLLGNKHVPVQYVPRKAGFDPDEARDDHGRWSTDGGPADLAGTIIGHGLDPSKYHEHAQTIINALDKQHEKDPAWTSNVLAVKDAMASFPMIHTSQLGNVELIEKNGLLPASMVGGGHLAFDRISGLDRTVFMRQGQAGGGGLGAVGVIVDPRELDPEKFLITKLGAMTLKQQEDAFLRTPGDHRALVESQLAPYRDTTISYHDLADVQARLLVQGYLKDHPDATGSQISPSKIVANDHGEMEVKYAGIVPPKAIIAYFAGSQPLKDFGGKTAYQYLQGKVPAEKLIQYQGDTQPADSLSALSAAYRAYYADKREQFVKSILRTQLRKLDPVRDFVSFKEDGDALLQMVSALHTNRLGSWGFMAQAQAQGMSQYMLRATLDDRTSNFCRMIDGRTFYVDQARPLIDEAVTADANSIKNIQPWPDQSKAAIAEYEGMTDDELASLGLNLPPFHPWCRTVCVSLDDQSRLEAPPERQQVLPESDSTAQDFNDLGIQIDDRQLAYWNDYIKLNPTNVLSTLQGVSATELMQSPEGDISVNKKGDIAVDWQDNQLTYNAPAGTMNYAVSPTATTDQKLKTSDAVKAVALSIGARRIYAAFAPGDALLALMTGYYPEDDEWDGLVTQMKDLLKGSLAGEFEALSPRSQQVINDVLASDESRDFLLLQVIDQSFLSKLLGNLGFEGEIDLGFDTSSTTN